MLYCLFILTVFDNNDNFWMSISVVFGIIFTFWCYMSIPLYIVDTIGRLKPEKVVEELVEQININLIKKISQRNNHTSYFTDNNHVSPDNDPLIAIVDIITGAVKEGHINTAETGLISLGMSFKKLVEDGKIQ